MVLCMPYSLRFSDKGGGQRFERLSFPYIALHYWGNVIVQVNLCKKFQLTYNMMRDCSFNSPKNTSSEHVVYKYCFECQNKKNNFCTQHVLNLYFLGNSTNTLLPYCRLTDARIIAVLGRMYRENAVNLFKMYRVILSSVSEESCRNSEVILLLQSFTW